MIQIVPLIGGKDWALYSQRTALDGKDYVFKLDWNGKSEGWYLALCDQDEVVIATCKITVGLSLFDRVVKSRRFPGKLYCVSLSNSRTDPTLDSLGVDHVLVYKDAAEFA